MRPFLSFLNVVRPSDQRHLELPFEITWKKEEEAREQGLPSLGTELSYLLRQSPVLDFIRVQVQY